MTQGAFSASEIAGFDGKDGAGATPGLGGSSSELTQGIFYPELTLGTGALGSRRASQLRQFLADVVKQRGCALHLANLWNALYFNYDLAHWGYHLDQIEPKRVPIRTAQARDVSLPIGGFVRVHTEAAFGDLFAEVIYKEGAAPALDEDWVAPELSGGPATEIEKIGDSLLAAVRERFVLDLEAFGAEANEMNTKQYGRLCRNARWLDRHGHLTMAATYHAEQADLEDLDYYADYLLREHRDGLLAFCFVEEPSDKDLREALLRSFDAVRDLAERTPKLRSWRGKYFFTSAGYQERLDFDGPLGEGDLRALFGGMARVPPGQSSCYSPIGPRIHELLERDGLSPVEAALLEGPNYATAVCYANTYLADTLAVEQDTGLLPSGVHLRLDDDWQAGGIWRAERIPADGRYSLGAVPATIPLGLGFSEALTTAEAGEVSTPDEDPIPSSQTGFRTPLTLRDRALSRLRLSAAAAESLAPGVVEVVIKHDGERSRVDVEREGTDLYGISYPWELVPGTILACNVESGGSVVRVRTVPVTPSLIAADGAGLRFETNLGVYEREMGLSELPAKDRIGAVTLRDLISRAFRVRGRRGQDGSYLLTLAELANVILGPDWRAGDTRPLAKALAEMGLERSATDFIWRQQVGMKTRASDRSLLAAYGETRPGGRFARTVRHHWVPMHLRRYAERSPSAEKRLNYAEARKRFGMHGVLPAVLPPDCTWVTPHDRGGDGETTENQQEPLQTDVADIESITPLEPDKPSKA